MNKVANDFLVRRIIWFDHAGKQDQAFSRSTFQEPLLIKLDVNFFYGKSNTFTEKHHFTEESCI